MLAIYNEEILYLIVYLLQRPLCVPRQGRRPDYYRVYLMQARQKLQAVVAHQQLVRRLLVVNQCFVQVNRQDWLLVYL